MERYSRAASNRGKVLQLGATLCQALHGSLVIPESVAAKGFSV